MVKRILIRIFVIAALTSTSAAFALDFTVTQSEDTGLNYLLVSGTFDDKKSGAVYKDVKSLDEQIAPLIKKPVVIFITSPGGTLDSTIPFAKRIDYWANLYYEKHKKPLVVSLMVECSSACTFFSAELTRNVDGETLVMLTPSNTKFHLHGPINEDTGKPMERKEDFEKFLAAGLKAYEESGVSSLWLKKHKSVFRTPVGKIFKAGELCKGNAGFLPSNACLRDHEAVTKKIAELTK